MHVPARVLSALLELAALLGPPVSLPAFFGADLVDPDLFGYSTLTPQALQEGFPVGRVRHLEVVVTPQISHLFETMFR